MDSARKHTPPTLSGAGLASLRGFVIIECCVKLTFVVSLPYYISGKKHVFGILYLTLSQYVKYKVLNTGIKT